MDLRLFSVQVIGAFLPFVAVALTGCVQVRPLGNTFPSADVLAAEVIGALAVKDCARLEAVALSEWEFREHVWDHLPAARPERNLPWSYVWGDLHQKSERMLTQGLARHGGRDYQLVSVTFSGKTDYGPYRVHRDATFWVRHGAGETAAIRVIGSMIEKDGAWKVFSYVVDE